MEISWRLGVSGDFATASSWNLAVVPGPADDATIGVKGTYTVTSSVDETVDSLVIAKRHTTLFIAGPSNFAMTNGGVNDGTILVDNGSALNVGTIGQRTTLTNLGNLDLNAAGSETALAIAGDVSLQGNGNVNLSGGGGFATNVATITGNGTLSTDNAISGDGRIGVTTLINEAGGIIDASSGALLITSGLVENSGILESTLGGALDFYPGSATIDNTRRGIIEANGANTSVDLDGVGGITIVGGTLETKGPNAVIELTTGNGVLDGTQPGNPINIEGQFLVEGDATLELKGTIHNTGVITAYAPGGGAWIVAQGDVTLEGGGRIALTNTAPNLAVSAIWGGVLINVDNVIFGTGAIDENQAAAVPSGSFINEAQGTIDANAYAPLVIAGVGPDTNAGLMEATHLGTLLIENVTIDNYLKTTDGTVEAGKDSIVDLGNAAITGGLVTALHGAIIQAEQGSNAITGALITNAGTLGAEGANLSIIGDVANTGTLDANNATLTIDGAVSGGKATIEGSGEINFDGASAVNVTFAAGNSNAILALDMPSEFTGTVSGFATGDYIDLQNINFADDPTLSFSSKTHLLTVADSVSGVTDAITFKGAVGSFSAQSDGDAGTLIADSPPTSNIAAVSHDHDTFAFAPNLGESTIANSNVHSASIDPPKPEFADLVTFRAQVHQDLEYPIAHDATDIAHHAALLGAQHTHDFLV